MQLKAYVMQLQLVKTIIERKGLFVVSEESLREFTEGFTRGFPNKTLFEQFLIDNQYKVIKKSDVMSIIKPC